MFAWDREAPLAYHPKPLAFLRPREDEQEREKIHEGVMDFIKDVFLQMKYLVSQCRISIRNCLGHDLQNKIGQLPIPEQFLNIPELNKFEQCLLMI